MIHCLHGAVGSPHDWDLFTDSFSHEIRPRNLWSLFEKGAPSLPEAGHHIAEQAEQNDILLGYSMGGRLALHALLSAPQKWRAAIIISAHPGLTECRTERLAHDETWAHIAEQDWLDFIGKWNQQPILSSSCHGLQQASPQDQTAIVASFRKWSLGVQDDLTARLPEISCPLLWVTGASDEKFTKLAQEATPLIPNAQHQIIKNAGHRAPWEQPELFSTAVQKFLKGIS